MVLLWAVLLDRGEKVDMVEVCSDVVVAGKLLGFGIRIPQTLNGCIYLVK